MLLKKGGHVVYFGETGDQCKELIRYFEDHGAKLIDMGENPANWMLREIQSPDNPRDLAEEYRKSSEFAELKRKLAEVKNTQIPALEVTFPTTFAAPSELRQRLMNKRLQTIYWRSPTYNLSRLLVCSIIAFILGSVFLEDRHPEVTTEAKMRANLSVIFLSFIIIGILSIISVLPVMLSIRDVFYRHRAAGMVDNVALGWAMGTAEKWFIVLASFLFCLVYVGVSGISTGLLRRAIRFWVRTAGEVCYNLKMNSTHASCLFMDLIGCLYFQFGHLLLFWSSVHVYGPQHDNGTDSSECIYRNQQLLFGIDCTSTVFDWFLFHHLLDDPRALRVRRIGPCTIQ